MEYHRFGSPEPGNVGTSSPSLTPNPNHTHTPKKAKIKLLIILAATLVAASAFAAAIVVVVRNIDDSDGGARPHIRRLSQSISKACGNARYQNLCVESLLDFPGAAEASEGNLVHMSVNVTLQKFDRALYVSSKIINANMDSLVRSAYETCMELLDESADLLSRSLTSIAHRGEGAAADVLTWLSASLTNQDTCTEAFEGLDGEVKDKMSIRLKDLSEQVSNCLSMYAATQRGNELSDIPVQNRGRRLMSGEESHKQKFPTWLSHRERMLLEIPAHAITADIIVSKDGNGTYRTIAEAIKNTPDNSTRRFIIYVRAGRYDEKILKLGRKKINIMLIGDGTGKTVITSGKSVQDNITTFQTASFAATGNGFMARDITFENSAGPSKHQAVALRIGADQSVVYRCNITGYQDTLYVHSQRQFYRECDIYGTVDFIFGNAAVVFQNCTIHARKPMLLQKNTITAQNRKDPNQNSGISIHNCRIVAEPDLKANKSAFPTYLGRPWKLYSRTVYMLSYMDDHIHPSGWLRWNETAPIDKLYYGEYMNTGPGGAIGHRVNWTGYHVIKTLQEAHKFTAGQFILGLSWLPSTGVPFMAGL